MRLRTAVIWNGVSQFGSTGITLLSTVILSRLLTPDDFAIIGIVTIFIAISQMMVDSEMGGALLRKPEVTVTDYSTLFYYNLGVSIVRYGVMYAIAPLIATFYSQPELTGVVRLLGVTILIQAFRVVQRIMIFRELKFRLYAVFIVVSGLVSLGTAVCLALKGYGYWSLVWQQIVQAVVTLLLMGAYNRFIPRLTFSKASFRYQFSFGINLLGSYGISTIANNISTNIIAKIASMNFTGYYTQVSRLTNSCQSALGPIMDQSVFPILSKYDSVEKVKVAYYRLLKLTTIVLVMISAVFVIFARPIISFVLGDQWLGGTYILQVLSIGIIPVTLQVLCRTIFKTLGSTRKILYLETLKSSIIIGMLLLAAFINADIVVWALVVAQAISCIIWLIFTERELRQGEMKRI